MTLREAPELDLIPRRPERQSAYPIRFPARDYGDAQDHEWCEVCVEGQWQRLRLHDYDRIYSIPGLYEHLFANVLQCCSPQRVIGLLAEVVGETGEAPTELRVLDLGAGNGMVGQQLRLLGVQHLVGADILPEADDAAQRDRPGIYDDYLVADFCALSADEHRRLRSHRFNCLSTVAALGFGDIPPKAFGVAFNCVSNGGWVAFNIKESFLSGDDESGFCRFVRGLSDAGILQFHAYRRYSHRRSIGGKRLHYVAMVGRKLTDAPEALWEA